MGDDSAGSGLELGWKRLADARASVCSDRPGVTGLSVQGCPAGLSVQACPAGLSCRAVLARRLLGERSQAITAWPRTAPPLERLDGIQPPGHRPVEP